MLPVKSKPQSQHKKPEIQYVRYRGELWAIEEKTPIFRVGVKNAYALKLRILKKDELGKFRTGNRVVRTRMILDESV